MSTSTQKQYTDIFRECDSKTKDTIVSIIYQRKYVYISYGKNPNLIKIGFTTSLREQASTLKENFGEGQTVHGRTALNPQIVVRVLHQMFKEKRVTRETKWGHATQRDWFDFTHDEQAKKDVLNLVTQIDQICNNRPANVIHDACCKTSKYKGNESYISDIDDDSDNDIIGNKRKRKN